MSAEQNRRLQIPNFLTHFVSLDVNTVYGLFFEKSSFCFFLDDPDSKTSNMLVCTVKLDAKKRFHLPERFWRLMKADNGKDFIFFPKNGKVYFTSNFALQKKNGL